VLPAEQRRAMFAIYAFCRAVDDVADGRDDRQARLADLARWRMDVEALFRGAPTSRLRGLSEPIRTFDLQREDFLSIIDGMEMDARADIRAPDQATLDLYCDRVACAVGRLSVRVFGIHGQDGTSLAFHLGLAEQRKGAPLTEEEVLRVRDEALCVMVTAAQARAMSRSVRAATSPKRIGSWRSTPCPSCGHRG